MSDARTRRSGGKGIAPTGALHGKHQNPDPVRWRGHRPATRFAGTRRAHCCRHAGSVLTGFFPEKKIAVAHWRASKTLVLNKPIPHAGHGFPADSIVSVLEHAPAPRQTLLFSATYPTIRKLSTQFQKNPVTVTVESLHTDTQIEQYFFECERKQKTQSVIALLQHYRRILRCLYSQHQTGLRKSRRPVAHGRVSRQRIARRS